MGSIMGQRRDDDLEPGDPVEIVTSVSPLLHLVTLAD